jgi:hypothetical protein
MQIKLQLMNLKFLKLVASGSMVVSPRQLTTVQEAAATTTSTTCATVAAAEEAEGGKEPPVAHTRRLINIANSRTRKEELRRSSDAENMQMMQ